MKKISRRILLIPLLTIFLLLAVDGFIISRINVTPSIYQEQNTFSFPAFHTKDLQGNIVTQDIFARSSESNISIVCLWVTQDTVTSRDLLCALANWQNNSTNKIPIIGIIGDLRETDNKEKLSLAQSVVWNLPTDIPQLMVNDELDSFLVRIKNAPTVCFVDGGGNLMGQPVVGNEPDLIIKEAERLIKTGSAQVQLEQTIQDNLFH